jgi:hypothetical protein
MSQALSETEISYIRNAHKAFSDCCNFFGSHEVSSVYDSQTSLVKYRPVLSVREFFQRMKDESTLLLRHDGDMEENFFWNTVLESFNGVLGASSSSLDYSVSIAETMLDYIDGYLQKNKYNDIEHTFLKSLQDEGFKIKSILVLDAGLSFLSLEQRQRMSLSRKFNDKGFLYFEMIIASICKKLEEQLSVLDGLEEKSCEVCE